MLHVAKTILLTIAFTSVAVCLNQRQYYGEKNTVGFVGDAVVALLSTESHPRCSVVIISDGNYTTVAAALYKALFPLQGWHGVSIFDVESSGAVNLTRAQVSYVVTQARRIRWRSGCVVVVTSSSDTNFLASLAEESRSGDLLVWPSRMVVATHLAQPIVLNLMQQHWTLSMTNAVLLNQEDHFNNSMWVAYQYRPHHSLPKHQVVRAAYWIPEEGIVTTSSYQLNKEFVKFRDGVSLIVTATHWPPHVYLFGNTEEVEDERREADSLNFQGPMANILTIIAQKLNFTYKLTKPPDSGWGNRLPNGTWTGMLGQVMRQEADIGLGPFARSPERMEIVDFTSLVIVDDWCMVAKKGAPEVDPWSFLLVFKPAVWAYLLGSFFLVWMTGILLTLTCKHSRSQHLWMKIFSHQLRILLRQDVKWRMVGGQERMVLSGWIIVGLVMMLSYSCQLISLMTVRNIPHPVQTLRDLIDNPDLTVIYVPNTIITSVMAESQGELHEVHKLQNVGRTNFIGTGSLANAIEMLVGRGDHVIIGTTNPMKRLIARSFSLTGKCDFYISQQIIYSNIMSMVGQKGSSIVRAISKWLSLVTEAGLYSKWLDSALNNYTICRQSPSKITIKSSITMNNIWGIMAVPLLGILLATVSFCYEMASYSIDIKIN